MFDTAKRFLQTAGETYINPIRTFGKQIGGGINIQLQKRRSEEENKKLQSQINKMVEQQKRSDSQGREILRKAVKGTQEQINKNVQGYRDVVKKEVRAPGEVLKAGLGTIANTAGSLFGAANPANFAKFAGTSGILGSLFGGGAAALQGRKPSEIIQEGVKSGAEFVGRAPAIYGVVKATDPFLASTIGKYSLPIQKGLSKIGLSNISQPLVRHGLPALLNAAQGAPVDIALGRKPFTPESVGTDLVTGALFGPGQFGSSPETQAKIKEGMSRISKLMGDQGGFIKPDEFIPGLKGASDINYTPLKQGPSIENIIESSGGWKPGARAQFDAALLHKDIPTVQRMLPEVPGEYRQRFSKEIQDVVQPKNFTPLKADISQTPIKVDQTIQQPPSIPTPPTTVLGKIQGGFEGGHKAREVKRIGPSYITQFIDRYAAIDDLLKKGKLNLPAEVNPYKRVRDLSGLGGKIETEIQEGLGPVLSKNKDKLSDLSSLLIMDRTKELIANGKKTFLSSEDLVKGQQELVAKYGADGFQQLSDSAGQVRQFGDSLLQRLKDTGIISEESFKNIKAKNQFYVPFEVVEHISDNLGKSGFNRNSYNVASQDVIKQLKGSEKELGDPIEAMVKKAAKVIALTEKNKALQSLVNLKNINPIFNDYIKPLKEGEIVPKDMDTISLFENGENVKYMVPIEVSDAIKNINSEASNALVKMGAFQAAILRTGSVILNIGFIPRNVVRDIQNALFTAGSEKGVGGILNLAFSYPAALASAIKRDDLYKQWLKEGGSGGSLTETIFSRPDVTVKDLAGIKPNIFRQVATSIPDGIKRLGEIAEQATRISRFKSGMSLGESPTEAAFQSRDVTVDFSKAGTTIKLINQVVPFLNAGIQGTERLFHAFKQNPIRASLSAGILTGLPTYLFYNYNRFFEDYNDIPQYERDSNYIIMFKDRTPEERADRQPLYAMKIPKGQELSPISNITENFLRWFDKNDPRAWPELIASTIGDISPIGLPYNEQEMGKTLSRTLPPFFRAGIETATGQSLFKGQPIVPEYLQDVDPKEQYTQYTPEIYKKAGQIFGVSPMKLENAIRTTTGGVGAQLAELASGNIKKGTIDQVTRGFLEVRGGEQVGREFEDIHKLEQEKATITLQERRIANELFDEITKAKSKEERLDIVKRYEQEGKINKRIEGRLDDMIKEKVLKMTSIERAIKNSSVRTRARTILNRLKKIHSKEERDTYIKRMDEIGVMTKSVDEEVGKLLEEEGKK